MRFNPLRIFQMKGRIAYYWTSVPASIVTVEYTCWKPRFPAPWRIKDKRWHIEATISAFGSKEIQTAKELEYKLDKYLAFQNAGVIDISVYYRKQETDKPKD